MFKITSGRGFHIKFKNGYTVSVQWGPGNYCDNYDYPISPEGFVDAGRLGSTTAECAVWRNGGELIERPGWNNTVSSYSTPEEVLELLNWAASQPAT